MMKTAPNTRMLDLFERRNKLDFGVTDAKFIFEKVAECIEADISVFVDGCPENRSWMARIIGRVIGPSTKKADPNRGARNNPSHEIAAEDKRV